MKNERLSKVNPWLWVPTLYFAEGIPYTVTMIVSVVMYKKMELSNTDIALYTSWLYLPWVIKPFWSPFVDLIKSKRWWIVIMQLIIGSSLAGIALSMPTSNFIRASLSCFWLLAFSSATHDIAVDGFYMLGLNENKQALFVGIRTIFYRLAMISGQGLLIMLAGYLENSQITQNFNVMGSLNSIRVAWMISLILLAITFLCMALYHKYVLPFPNEDIHKKQIDIKSVLSEFKETIIAYFNKKEIWIILSYLMLFRLSKAQLLKISAPFFLDSINAGGLALTTTEVGFISGTLGLIALIIGGFLGGLLASIYGLKRLLWIFVFFMNIPSLVYIYFSYSQTGSLFIISSAVVIEQFGYGFGFTAFSLYMLSISIGKYKTSNYAFSTGIMALGMMLPGMISGWLQELWGYQHFFIWVMLCTLPAFILTKFIRVDADFGIKTQEKLWK